MSWRSLSRPPRRFGRAVVAVLVLIGVSSIGCGAYNHYAGFAAHRWADAQPKNEATGVLKGAEAYVRGPEDAPATVVLVHGFVGAANNFNELPQRLVDAGYRVSAMRLPGHGTTPFDAEGVDAATLLQAVIDEARKQRDRGGKIVLVGHSMGGALATLASAIIEPSGLVLAAPYFRVTHRWYYGLRPETWTVLTHRIVRWTHKPESFIRVKRAEARPEIVSYDWFPSSLSYALTQLGPRARDTDTLSMVSCPVLVLHSEDDNAASPNAAQAAFDALGSTDKEFVWVENSDHHLFWDYEREMVYDTVIEFVERIAPAN